MTRRAAHILRMGAARGRCARGEKGGSLGYCPARARNFFAQRSVCSTLFARIPRVPALVLGQRGLPRRKRVMARRRESARRLFSKAERKDTDEQLQRGCRRGLEGGAPWGGSPKQHPPSPPEAKHFEESKKRCQADRALHPYHSRPSQGRAALPPATASEVGKGRGRSSRPPPLPPHPCPSLLFQLCSPQKESP